MTVTTNADTAGPSAGTVTLSSGASPLDAGAPLTVSFADWTDVSLPLVYDVLVDGTGVSAPGSSGTVNLTAPLTVGTHTLTGQIYDAFGNLTTVTQNFTVLTPQQTWRRKNFGITTNTGNAADTAAPAGDGVANLTKYALGASPLVSGTTVLPASSFQTISGEQYLTLSFTHSLTATDVTCNIDVSGGLSGSWYQGSSYSPANGDVPANTYTTQVSRTPSANGATETIVVRDNVPCSQFVPFRFMRLRVTQP